MLCCIFNYAPKYRESIFKLIDENFDAQFIFGREVVDGKTSGIAKLNYGIFKRKPVENKNKVILRKILWRTGLLLLPFRKKYTSFLITADTPMSYIPFLILCKLMGKKVYAWGHGFKDHFKRLTLLEKLYRSTVKCFFTYGENGKNRMLELGWPSEKLSVIYNSLNEGVSLERNQDLLCNVYKEHFANDYPVLVFIGRLISSKRLDWLINVLSDLKTKGLNLNLMIIGAGPEYSKLLQLIKDFSLEENVWLYGECYKEDELNSLLYNADLCVSPGEVGLTALHAMSYGVPVISHDNFYRQGPEYESIVPGKTGCLYQFGNYDDLLSKINDWFTQQYDRSVIRENCYKEINTCWNSNYQIELLQSVMKC